MRSTSSSRPRSCRRLLLLFQQPPLDDGLRGDAGVVGAGHPEGVEALHPPPADQDVLQRVVERMAQVQSPGHVRRRDDDRERLAACSGSARCGSSRALPRSRYQRCWACWWIVLLGEFSSGWIMAHVSDFGTVTCERVRVEVAWIECNADSGGACQRFRARRGSIVVRLRHSGNVLTLQTHDSTRRYGSSVLLALSSLQSLYSKPSTRASQLASMTFSETPTVPQTSCVVAALDDDADAGGGAGLGR